MVTIIIRCILIIQNKKQKNVSFGIYARDRNEFVKISEQIIVKPRKRQFQVNFLLKISGLLKTLVVTEFIQATQGNLVKHSKEILFNLLPQYVNVMEKILKEQLKLC